MINGNAKPKDLLGLKMRWTSRAMKEPVRHATALRIVEESIVRLGYEKGKIEIAVTDNRHDMLVAVEVRSHGVLLPPHTSAWVGLLHCNSNLRASRFYAGIMYAGAGIVYRRFPPYPQSKLANYEASIAEGVYEWAETLKDIPEMVSLLKTTRVSRQRAALLAMKAYRKGETVLPARAFSAISKGVEIPEGVNPQSALGVLWEFGKSLEDHAGIMMMPRTDQMRRLAALFNMVMRGVKA